MSAVQIPPESVPAEFDFEVPAPGGMTTLGGVKVQLIFSLGRPQGFFSAQLYVDGELATPMDGGMDPTGAVYLYPFFDGAIAAPLQAKLVLNDGSHLDPGNTVTISAWGAQTAEGTGALNPDAGENPTVLTGAIEVGTVEVLEWLEWNRITGANQGEQDAGS